MLVVASPTGRIRLTAGIVGSLPSVLFEAAVFGLSAANQGETISLVIGNGVSFWTTSIVIKQTSSSRRVLQRIVLVRELGSQLMLPEGADVDLQRNAFVVDAAPPTVLVRIGGAEVALAAPANDQIEERQVGEQLLRWVGEDRSPTPDPPPSPKVVRLLEQVGIRGACDPRNFSPYWGIDGSLNATAGGVTGRLDVVPHDLEMEAMLLGQPRSFVKGNSDATAAEENVREIAPAEIDAWLDARELFFRGVREYCLAHYGPPFASRASVYLADLALT